MALHVDTEKAYGNLSRRRVSKDDAKACEERFSKSKNIHSILRHVAETMDVDLEAFKLMVTDPDSILDCITVGDDCHEDTMRKAVAASTKECLVKAKLVAPPLYVLNTRYLDKVSHRGDNLLYEKIAEVNLSEDEDLSSYPDSEEEEQED